MNIETLLKLFCVNAKMKQRKLPKLAAPAQVEAHVAQQWIGNGYAKR